MILKAIISQFYINREGILSRETILVLESTRINLVVAKTTPWEPFLGQKQNEKFSTS